MRHRVNLLSVVIPGRCEGVDDPAIRQGKCRVGDIGRNDVYRSLSEQAFFSADDHFQLAFGDIGDLFVDVLVFGQSAILFNIPEYERAIVAVDHFPEKTGTHFFFRDVLQVFHRLSEGTINNVDKWISGGGAGGIINVSLLQIIYQMKTSFTLLFTVLFSCVARAQTPASPFVSAIDSILRDFPNNLRHISGDLVLAQGEFENYISTVQLPGSADCLITRWHSTEDTTASWQAKMYSGDDFGAAEKCYHQIYRQLKTCYLRLQDSSLAYLTGVWNPAKEEAAFTSSTLRLGIDDWRYRKVEVEVELVYLLADWAVRINIISKPPDEMPAAASTF